MDKKPDDRLDPKAKGKKTPQADFDRNRDGLWRFAEGAQRQGARP